MKNALVPPRPDKGLPPPPLFARGVAIFASAWWPYVTLAVALIMLLIERDQSKRVVLKKWAKWAALYLVVWVTGIVLVALLMSLNHAY